MATYSNIFDAIRNGTDEDVKWFVEQKCVNVNTRGGNESGATPVHTAAASGKIDILKYLRAKGADVSVCLDDGSTLLHGAARFNHNTECVEYLIAECPYLIVKTNNNIHTPLHVSALNANGVEILKCLISHGADVNRTDSRGARQCLKI
jgi:ankyrin repeat protein